MPRALRAVALSLSVMEYCVTALKLARRTKRVIALIIDNRLFSSDSSAPFLNTTAHFLPRQRINELMWMTLNCRISMHLYRLYWIEALNSGSSSSDHDILPGVMRSRASGTTIYWFLSLQSRSTSRLLLSLEIIAILSMTTRPSTLVVSFTQRLATRALPYTGKIT